MIPYNLYGIIQFEPKTVLAPVRGYSHPASSILLWNKWFTVFACDTINSSKQVLHTPTNTKTLLRFNSKIYCLAPKRLHNLIENIQNGRVYKPVNSNDRKFRELIHTQIAYVTLNFSFVSEGKKVDSMVFSEDEVNKVIEVHSITGSQFVTW